jgi:hypothetical protein
MSKQTHRIAVLNFSGNVGKTTLATHLFAPRLSNPKLISVESLNIDGAGEGIDVERMRGTKFGEIQRELWMHEGNAVVDVGASNVEAFMKSMSQFAGSHEDYTLFAVPAIKDKKAQGDTINTIRALSDLGVSADRIKLIFNRLDVDESAEDEFPGLFGFHEADGLFTLLPTAVIRANDVFERLKGRGKTLSDVINDKTDYRSKFTASSSEDDKDACLRALQIRQLAGSAHSNLDEVFKLLMSTRPAVATTTKAAKSEAA